MPASRVDLPCPERLEDEAFLIETSGEMPEVALQESLAQIGELSGEELDCLRAATARAYLRLIRRDLDHAAVGLSHFRGLERAGQNLERLRRYLVKLGWEMPAQTARELGEAFTAYLRAEGDALAQGRAYASGRADDARALAAALGIDPAPLEPVLALMAGRPAPDFRGLACLRRLAVEGASYKRRREGDGACQLEVLDVQAAQALARANLPLTGPDEKEDPECRRRLETVWSLIDLPERGD
jgi:hypothetical protein